ncbi:MAG: hypothetical protein AB8G96_04405 [Phycisphaerales bacterium]
MSHPASSLVRSTGAAGSMLFVLAGIAAMAFGLYRGAEAIMDANPEWYRHPARWSNHANSIWIERDLAERTGPAILIAGSSTTRTAFDGEIFREILSETSNLPADTVIDNLSNSATDSAGILHWLLWLEKHSPDALPDVLVHGIEPTELQGAERYLAMRSHLTRYFADPHISGGTDVFRTSWSEARFSDQSIANARFPLHARRTLLRGMLIGRVVWPFFDRGWIHRRWLSRWTLRPYTWDHFRVVRPSDDARRKQGLDKLEARGEFDAAHYPYEEVDLDGDGRVEADPDVNPQALAVRRIAEFCERRGIVHLAVVVPLVPEMPRDRIAPELWAQWDRMIRTAVDGTQTRVLWAWTLLEGPDFFDSLHIAPTGRGVTSRAAVAALRDEFELRGIDGSYRRPEAGVGQTAGEMAGQPSPQAAARKLLPRRHIVLELADRATYFVPADADRSRKDER